MDVNTDDFVTLVEGMDVFDAAGDKVGKIVDVEEESILVEKGFFFRKDYLIPVSIIEGVNDDDQVFLTVPKESLTDGDYAEDNAVDAAPAFDPAIDAGSTFDAPYVEADADVVTSSEVVAPEYVAESGTTATAGADATRVPVYEEEITPIKRAVSRGAVRIQKELVTENRTITVPVTEERVRITRVDTDELIPGGSDVLQDGTIEIPISGEEVDLQTSVRQTGEVIIEKESVQRDQTVAGTVRREEVTVDDETIAGDGTASTRRDDI